MKRLLAVVLLFLPGLAFGAARTASVDGLWSATATWGGAAVPELTDSCTISAGIEVVCDADPCQCGDLTVTGLLTFKDGARTLKLGNATGVAADGDLTITASTGAVMIGAGQDIEFNCDRSGGTAACELTVNGTLVMSGNVVFAGGTIAGLGAITDSGSSRSILITDPGNVQPAVDYYVGKYLVPTSGYFRNHYFPILASCTGATTGTVCVDMDARGALDTRNTVNSVAPQAWAPGDWGQTVYRADASADDATVANGGTALTFSAGIFADAATATRALFGSRFVCAADLDTVNDTHIRRICSVTSATAATLCSTYGTASCATGAGFHVFDDNVPPRHIIIQEALRVGDTYKIVDAAVGSITAANKSNTAPSDHWNLTANSGSNTFIEHAILEYCGQDLDGGSSSYEPSCVLVDGVDNDNDSEQFVLRNSDLWMVSGENAVHLFDSDNITIERVNLHDCVEGGEADAHECHGVYIEDENNSNVTGMKVLNSRITRMNDAGIVVTGDETTGIGCTDCLFIGNQVGFIPANGQGAGTSATGFTITNAVVNSRIGDNLVHNVDDRLILIDPTDASPDSAMTLSVDHNIIVNSQVITSVYAGDFSATTGLTDALNQIGITNNVIAGYTQGPQRGYLYSNFEAPLNAQTSSSMGGCGFNTQGAFGNVCLTAGGITGNGRAGFSAEPTSDGLATLFPDPMYVQDNSVYGSTTPQGAVINTYILFHQAANAVTTPNDFVVDHNSVVCQERHTTTTDLQAIQAAPAAGASVTVSNNVAYDCSKFINETAAGTGGTTDSVSNLRLAVTSADSNVNTTSGDLTTGTVSFEQMQAGDLACNEGSTPWSSLGTDGYPRGVRVAGPPDPSSFLMIYPFPLIYDNTGVAPGNYSSSNTTLLPIVNANTIGDKDTDGDGVWDLHDNCDGVFNPSQLDTDGDDKGDACDR